MTNLLKAFSALLFSLVLLSPAYAEPVQVGQPAPSVEFTLHDGTRAKLDNYRGKTVVLEWFNPDCPFVKKHYSGGDMQSLQKEYAAKNIVWLTVNSTAADHPSYIPAANVSKVLGEHSWKGSGYVVDDSGALGRAFGAKTTPHMFVIDAQGKVVYAGAIDDNPAVSSNPKEAKNYVRSALDSVLQGGSVATAQSQAYGCSIKYKS